MSEDERARRKAYHDKLASVGVMKGGRSRDRVREFRREDGTRCKTVTDQLGNDTTYHNEGDNERVDVMIRPKVATASTKTA